MKHYSKLQLNRIATDLFKKPTAKNPSPTLLKVKATAKKLIEKYRKAK